MAADKSEFTEYPELHLDNQLCFSLYRLSRMVTQKYTPLLKPLDITYPQYLVLLVLWQNEEQGLNAMSVSQLTTALQLDTGTVTPLLKRMEAKGILSRKRDSVDERIVLVSLCEKGQELREQAKSIPQKLLCKTDLRVEQLGEMKAQLQFLISQINA